jgi:hypothetical protein
LTNKLKCAILSTVNPKTKMSEQLQYENHILNYYLSGTLDPTYRGELFSKGSEAHELATDIQHVGAIALLSEVQTAQTIGSDTSFTVPNPVQGHKERRTLNTLIGTRKRRHERTASLLESAGEALDNLQTGLEGYATSDEAGWCARTNSS